jgi:hypothetical protein
MARVAASRSHWASFGDSTAQARFERQHQKPPFVVWHEDCGESPPIPPLHLTVAAYGFSRFGVS